MNEFDHEKLDVYVAAIDFVALDDEIVERLPRGRAYLADQMRRAATSIPLNIAVPGSSPEVRRLVSMLVRMVRRTEESGTGSGSARE